MMLTRFMDERISGQLQQSMAQNMAWRVLSFFGVLSLHQHWKVLDLLHLSLYCVCICSRGVYICILCSFHYDHDILCGPFHNWDDFMTLDHANDWGLVADLLANPQDLRMAQQTVLRHDPMYSRRVSKRCDDLVIGMISTSRI